MGWASGSEVFDQVWKAVRKHIPQPDRVSVCAKVLQAFENADCDTLNECFDAKRPEVETAYYMLNPGERA